MVSKQGIVLLCPSWGKACGIAEYTRYVAEGLRSGGHNVCVVESVQSARRELKKDVGQLLIVQHEYSLFDHLDSYLSGPDSSQDLYQLILECSSQGNAAPWVVMHSMDQRNPLFIATNEVLLASSARVFGTHPRSAELHNVEWVNHGVRETQHRWTGGNLEAHSMKDLTCVSFGLLNHVKGVSTVLEMASSSGFTLHACWPTKSMWNRRLIQRAWRQSKVAGTLNFDFIEDSDLFEIMSDCDFVLLPQRHISNSFVSGSARLGVSLGVPVVTSDSPQFEDLGDAVYSLPPNRMGEAIGWISDPANRIALSKRSLDYSASHSIESIYAEKIANDPGSTRAGSPSRAHSSSDQDHLLKSDQRSKLRIALSRAKQDVMRIGVEVELRAAALGLWPSGRALRRVGG
jgi:hypothetical protein